MNLSYSNVKGDLLLLGVPKKMNNKLEKFLRL